MVLRAGGIQLNAATAGHGSAGGGGAAAYEAPTLIVHGPIEAWTKGTGASSNTDVVFLGHQNLPPPPSVPGQRDSGRSRR